MFKTLLFLLLTFILFTGNATAAFMTNVHDGCFEFRLDIRHMGSYVNYSKLSLFLQDQARNNEVMVFEELTITSIGQKFVLTETDAHFSGASALLTNGETDWINVSLLAPTRTSSIDATEPEALFGEATGTGKIDFAGSTIESIELLVTDLFFIDGFDPNQGIYTNIAVQGLVTVETVGSTHLNANFSAAPTSGTLPLKVQFTDQSTGTVGAWNWGFGDGLSSGEQHPSHTYNEPGSYTVNLTVTGPDGSNTETKANYIKVNNPSKALPWLMMIMD